MMAKSDEPTHVVLRNAALRYLEETNNDKEAAVGKLERLIWEDPKLLVAVVSPTIKAACKFVVSSNYVGDDETKGGGG